MMMRFRSLFFLAALISLPMIVTSQFKIASIFGDSMVVQQRSNVPFWGTGAVGAAIDVSASWGKAARTRVGADGRWMLKLPTPKAGGPYALTIKTQDTTVVLKNILVGEVWLAAGQSNMELPLAGWPPSDTVANSAAEIGHSRNDAIRMFTVSHVYSLTPESSVSGSWVAASPEASGAFSATAYFFAKALHAALRVPIGIIHSSWGGTQIEPWMSAGAISKFDAAKQLLQKTLAGSADRKKYADWLRTFPTIDMTERSGDRRWAGLEFQDERCSMSGYDDSLWREMKLPQNWERTEMGDFNGAVWFRKTVQVPASWVKKNLTVELGPVDDMDVTFVNGKRVGGMEADAMWNVARSYGVPDSAVTSTTVSIAVRVVDQQAGGGIYGKESRLALRLTGTEETVPLAGAWKYLPVANYDGRVFSVFGEKDRKYYSHPPTGIPFTNYTPTSLYNAMIAPLVPFTIKGAIWYQGESNISIPDLYRSLLPALIGDWRKQFRCGEFPFYYVQIAPFAYDAGSHSELLREAQSAALGVKNTGMAVTLDIGSVRTIHPSDKKNVGERLAKWALAKNYDKPIPYSGPVYRAAKKEHGALVLSFYHAGSTLVLKEKNSEFQIAGADRIFKPASVTVRGGELVVSHPEITHPAAVRYAFTDTSSAVLFNTDGLPASSFRTDAWK